MNKISEHNSYPRSHPCFPPLEPQKSNGILILARPKIFKPDVGTMFVPSLESSEIVRIVRDKA